MKMPLPMPFLYKDKTVQDGFIIYTDCTFDETTQRSVATPQSHYEQISLKLEGCTLYLETLEGDDLGTLSLALREDLTIFWVYEP